MKKMGRLNYFEATEQDLPPGVRPEPGYLGVFTRHQAPGCWPNDTRVIKTDFDRTQNDESTVNGTLGTVLGSLYRSDLGALYFVEWDDKPKKAFACYETKLRRVET